MSSVSVSIKNNKNSGKNIMKENKIKLSEEQQEIFEIASLKLFYNQ